MIARDVMIGDIAFVTPSANLGEVARLLGEARAGAVPIVDEARAPIGIVTRSDLLACGDAHLGAKPPSWLVKDARRFSVSAASGRSLREVMTSPAFFVPEATAIEDIARVMETRRLKRLPVVDGRELVGLLWRPDVLRALEGVAPGAQTSAVALSAEAFRSLIAVHEKSEMRERAEAARLRQEAETQRIEELAHRQLTDRAWRELMEEARRSAASGMKEFMLIRFPSRLCADGGRAINAPDPRWPATLRGEPRDIFERWRGELEPLGFRLAAQIVDFPNGVPGDAALFLIWAG